jgi:TolB protein
MLRVTMAVFGAVLLVIGGVLSVTRADAPPPVCVAFIGHNGLDNIYRTCPREPHNTPHVLNDTSAPYSDLAISPDHRRMAFVSWADDDARLFHMDSDGDNLAPYAITPLAYIEAPAWSADGEWIVFVADPGGLYRLRADGSALYTVSSAPEASFQYLTGTAAPVWSPDGEWIVFVSRYNRHQDLYRVRRDGSELQRLTDTPGHDRRPRWSPDGEWLVFVSERSGDPHLYRMRPDGSGVQRLTGIPSDQPVWSPDGQWIAFVGQQSNGNWSVYRIAPDGGQLAPITRFASRDATLLWSTDSRRIAVQHMWTGTVQLFDPDGHFYTPSLNTSSYATGLAWVPVPARPWRGWLPVAVGGVLLAGSAASIIRKKRDE